MTDTPTPAVLVDVDGIEHWCMCEMRQSFADGSEYVYAYRDAITRVCFAPFRCKEIRKGLIKIAVEEVKA